jgi:hypothetical protein
MKSIVLAAALLVPAALTLEAQDHAHCAAHSDHSENCPKDHAHCAAHSDHSNHDAQVDSRGDAVMGFDHDKTTHGFRLTPRGGVIEVMTNGPKDADSRAAIQSHLTHIAKMFAEGNFEAPFLIHGQQPPGVDVMKRDKDKIHWEYVETEKGGRVVATTEDAKALEAIHAFLRFQIAEHRTGDSAGVQKDDEDEKE